MSRIDELIAELCPDGVRSAPLEAVTIRITDGSHNPPRGSTDGGYPMISAKNINAGHIDLDDARMLDAAAYESENRRTDVQLGDVLLTIVGAIGRAAVVDRDEPMVFQRSVCVIKPARGLIEPRFLRYVLDSSPLQRTMATQANGAAQKGLYLSQVAKLIVPVPPLEVQREIVRILDQFTQLEAELEAELEARTRQYAHYRDHLLELPEATRAPMGSVGAFVRGRRFTKSDVVESGIPSIHYGEIYTHYGVAAAQAVREVDSRLAAQLRFAEPGDVVFAGVGETVADVGKAVAWLGDTPVAVHDDTFAFSSSLNPKFVAYFSQTRDFNTQKTAHVAQGKVKRLSAAGLTKVAIPVPSPEVQARIVGVLDDFSALVTDMSVGLPAELAARRKQYEYYRDRLLTFEEATA